MTELSSALAAAWQLHEKGLRTEAEQAYRHVIASHPQSAEAWCYLAMALHDQAKLDEALAAYDRSFECGRLDPTVWANRSNTLMQLGRFDEAVAANLEALSIDPDHARAHYNLGQLYLRAGDFERGWRECEWRFKTRIAHVADTGRPRWEGSPLDGKTVLLQGEQGIGDEVQFVRYGALLAARGARVVATVQRTLLPLLERTPGIDRLLARDDALPPFDLQVPMMSVPAVLGRAFESTLPEPPYVYADERLVEYWRAELALYPGHRVGIVWQGNVENPGDAYRSIPLELFSELATLPGVQLFSLQRGPGAEQLERLRARLPIVALGLRADQASGPFMDTAAILKNLDLLVSCDTATAHIAGAMAVPTWLVLPAVADWRWRTDTGRTPWYPSVRLYRQAKPGDWSGVFEHVRRDLESRVQKAGDDSSVDHRIFESGLNVLSSARHGAMLYSRHDRIIGRSLDCYGEYSEGELLILGQLLEPGAVIVEAGANIGAHTVPLAGLAGPSGRVLAFEPQRLAFQALCANVALNSLVNVECVQAALGAVEGLTTVAAMSEKVAANFGAVTTGGAGKSESVRVTRIDALALARCDLIKADVEGVEVAVLRGAAETIARHRPVLYVENDREDRSRDLIECILGLGYALYWHLPPLFNPDNYFGNARDVFGPTISANMLCLPADVPADVRGLLPVEGPHDTWKRAVGRR